MTGENDQAQTAAQAQQSELIRSGIARQQRGDFAGAETLYKQVLKQDPEQPDALHLLGLIAVEAGQSAVATDLIRRAIRINQHNPAYHHNLGIIYELRGENDEAIVCNQRALYLKPDFFGARFSLANQLHAEGRSIEAVEQYRQALVLSPETAEVHSNFGAVLAALGRHEEAIASYQRALELAPKRARILSNLGTAQQSLGRLDLAIVQYQKAIELEPSFADAYTNLAEALLEQGDANAGLETAQRCLTIDPGNRAALALCAIAANATGDDALRDELLDSRLIRPHRISPPPESQNDTISSLAEFNSALCRHIENHLTLNYEPAGKSTRHGFQTGELLAEPKGPVAWLETQIRAAVEEYLLAIPADSDHPFLSQKPENWNLAVWATVLSRSGHQLPHIHPSAWLSGVYYAAVPEQDEPGDAGWIEFGSPPACLESLGQMPTWRYEPVPEMLYLFPSYFYHRTIPFAGDKPRVSIAFDVVPLPAVAAPPPMTANEVENALATGHLLLREGNHTQAREMADRVMRADPGEHRALYLLARIARSDGKTTLAVDLLQRAVGIASEEAQYHWELSQDLIRLQRYEESSDALHRALDLGMSSPQIYSQLGATLADMARFDDAIEAYRKALDDPATMGTAYYGMSLVSGYTPDAERIEKMKRDLGRDDLDPREEYNLNFALGRACMQLGKTDTAFAYLSKGNEIQHRNKTFSLAAERENTKRIIRAFPRSLFEEHQGGGDPSEVPVFIIGMPRSGTTLVEQIIASHPDAHGAGELNDLWRVVNDVTMFLPPGGSLPDDVAAVHRDAWRMLGEQYVKTIQRYAPGTVRITDKLPFNYTLTGIIHLMLPNARIIHCKRNPLDTCVSCFSISFGSDRGFTNDLRDLGGTYRTYQDLMAHWHEVMPGRIHDVQYEELVEDTEAQARALIDHLGLEWDSACLDFYKHERLVSTASVAQVRKPVYKTSIERWRLFEKHLGPLIMALEEDY